MNKYMEIMKSAFLETMWPTRCAICDKPGYIVCDSCIKKLNFIDTNKSCNRCGEPYGYTQCCSCDDSFKLNKIISCTILEQNTGGIITSYKDAGEIRLSKVIAKIMSMYIPKTWTKNTVLTFIPSSQKAYNKRGYDHAEILAKELSNITNIRLEYVFDRPKSIDQRQLGRNERQENMENIINTITDIDSDCIIIDDVYTTGATLNAAASKLNCDNIFGLTFTRTWLIN